MSDKPQYKTEPAPRRNAPKPHDAVNHPKHYNSHASGVECITIARHMPFNLGNVLKYIWRAGEKGDAIEDLQKARFYLNDEIERRINERVKKSGG